MKPVPFLLTFLACTCSVSSLFAQLPPNQPEQDCFGAISICQDVYVQPNSYVGAGEEPYEISGANSCMLIGERNSVWYIFTVQTAGELCFTINPFDPLDDYDWALFDLTNADCSDIPDNPNIEVRCNWTFNSGCAGRTGANSATECPIQNEPCIVVQPGQTFVLNVSNFTGSGAGYTLDLSQSTAELFDDIPPQVRSIRPNCSGVTVTFNEQVLCSSVQPSDFTFTGPGGPYTVSAIRNAACETGAAFGSSFDLVLEPFISQPGAYTVALVGAVTDNCGNPAVLMSQPVNMPQPPVAAFNPQAPQCQNGNRFGFGYTGPSQVGAFRWQFGDGNGSSLPAPIYSYNTFGDMTVTLEITDNNGCRDTATRTVTVRPKPLAGFETDPVLCEGDSIEFRNLTVEQGGQPVTRYRWFFGDGGRTETASPIHPYAESGLYRVFLEAVNALGCRDTLSRLLPVRPKPDMGFVTEENVCFGDTVNLRYATTLRGGLGADSVTAWSWNFGDGTTLQGNLAPAHLYAAPGTFPVTLTAETSYGCVDSLTQPQVVYQPAPPAIGDSMVCIGERNFISGIPEPGGITRWYLGRSDASPFFEGPVYETQPILFSDTLWAEVLSVQGCLSERAPVRLRHYPVGEGRISLPDTNLYFPDPLAQPLLEGSIEAAVYVWNFGDGQTASDPEPSYRYSYPGRYTLSLDVTDINGCPYTLSRLLEVKPLPPILAPTAFTPNGDGINDEYWLSAQLMRQFRFQVFNRQGQVVFESDTPEFRWDGRSYNGRPLQEGVYAFRISGQDHLGNTVSESGTITLIR
ncbi:MAG: PKD domain-containing protein [Bacteroidia bacterium]|nr:PKD domain-containing protein [Bacteroidia bacterium]